MVTNATVQRLLHDNQRIKGVELVDGSQLEADIVVANCTPYHAFVELLPDHADVLPKDFISHIKNVQYSGAPIKINMALDRLPNFTCLPNEETNKPGPQHRGTIHFENHPDELV